MGIRADRHKRRDAEIERWVDWMFEESKRIASDNPKFSMQDIIELVGKFIDNRVIAEKLNIDKRHLVLEAIDRFAKRIVAAEVASQRWKKEKICVINNTTICPSDELSGDICRVCTLMNTEEAT